MGLKTQNQIRSQQRQRRKKRRDRLVKKGQDMTSYYFGKFYVKLGE